MARGGLRTRRSTKGALAPVRAQVAGVEQPLPAGFHEERVGVEGGVIDEESA